MAGEILEDKDAMHEKWHYDATRGCGAGAAVTARLWEKLNGNPNLEGAQDCNNSCVWFPFRIFLTRIPTRGGQAR